MGITSDKLLYLQDTKLSIKQAIEDKGVTVNTGTSFRDYATKILEITTGGGGAAPDPWVRPEHWIDLPEIDSSFDRVSILNAVFKTDSEYVSFVCTTDSGMYTVDWGDGTIESYDSGIKAQHKYDYYNEALNIDDPRYNQCIIDITTEPDCRFTLVNLNTYHNTIGTTISYPILTTFLDINVCINGNAVETAFRLGAFNSSGQFFAKHTMLEHIKIGYVGSGTYDMSYLCYNCSSIKSVELDFPTSTITNWSSAFSNCSSLQKAPPISHGMQTNVLLSSMYAGCYSIVEISPIVVGIDSPGAVQNMFNLCKSLEKISITINSSVNYGCSNMFSTCSNLKDVQFSSIGSGRVNNMSSMFDACSSLKVLPFFDTGGVGSFTNAFRGTGVVSVPNYSYLSATSLSSIFYGCYSLIYVPQIQVSSNCTTMASAFSGCTSLEYAPNIVNSFAVTNISTMFYLCSSLMYVPTYNFPSISGGNAANVFTSCTSLIEVPIMNFGTTHTSNSSILASCYSLRRMLMPLKYSFSVANGKMSVAALDEMYTVLPTVTGQTVTVTGNYGATSTPVVSSTKSFNEGSKIVAMTDTTNLSVGMFVAGIGTTSTTGKSCTFTNSGNLVTSTGHSLIDGNIVSFNTLNGPTGIVVKTIYYVVNATTNTFQLSLTQGGSVIGLVAGAGSNGIYNSPAFITAITTNVSIELSLPMTMTGTESLAFRSNDHKTYLATMKGWTVTG